MNKHLLHHITQLQAETHGTSVAVAEGNQQLTYAQLDGYANQLAHALLRGGLQTGDRVGVYMTACTPYIVAITAIMKAGGIFLPLDAAYPPVRLGSFIAEAQPRFMLTLDRWYDACVNCCGEAPAPLVLVLSCTAGTFAIREPGRHLPDMALPDTDPGVVLDGDNSNYLLFTSGSTGQPKGIEGRHKSLSHFVHWEMKQFGLGGSTKISLLAPITFDVSLRDIFVPLAAGGTICIPGEKEKQEPAHFLQWLQQEGVTLMHCVPSFLRLLMAALQDTPALCNCLQTLRHILVAGEPLYGKDVNAWKALVGPAPVLVNLYGPSETTLAKLFYTLNGGQFADGDIVPLGQPLSNTVALVVKEQMLCPVREAGEIMIKTPFMTKGYYNNAALNGEKFIQNPLHNDFADLVFRTGDLGYYDEHNNIHFAGRMDDMVKFNGNRIELAELQKTALLHPAVREAIALLRRDAAGEEQLALYVTMHQPVTVAALQQHFATCLPAYMHPAQYLLLEQFPTTPNGKVDKTALAAIAPLPVKGGEPLTDETEIAIGEVWKTLLKTNDITRETSFFQAGGSSLKAIQMIAKLYKQNGVLLNVREIMAQPTIPGIRALMAEKQGMATVKADAPAALPRHLSVLQQQVLQWSASESQWADFNMPYAFHIQGHLQKDLLPKALAILTAAHPFFQMALQDTDGRWERVITKELPDYAVVDIAAPDQEAVQEQCTLLSRMPFEKTKPLVRFRLLDRGDDRYVFLLMTHLSVCDGVTAQQWIGELWQIYRALSRNETYAAAAIPGVESLVQRETTAIHAAYWKTVYSKTVLPGSLPVPAAFDSDLLVAHRFVCHPVQQAAWEKRLSASGTSLEYVLLAAFEQAMAAVFPGGAFTYHAVVSDRGQYTPGTAANLLYYLPVTVPAILPDGLLQLERVRENISGGIAHLPMVYDAAQPRPVMVVNIVPGQEITEPEAAGLPVIMPYAGTIHRERFPVNVSISTTGGQIAVAVDHIFPGINFEQRFEATFCAYLHKLEQQYPYSNTTNSN